MGDKDTAMGEVIGDIQTLSMQTRMKAHRERVETGTVSDELHRELAARVLQYADALRVFRYQIDDYPDIDRVRAKMGSTTTVEKVAPGDTDNTEQTEVPAVVTIPAERLLSLLDRLDDCAQQVGYGAPVDADDRRMR
jgi:hypothetical protein